jgi:hypothetical protein
MSQRYWRGFVGRQRALVLGSLVEGIGAALLAISSWLAWPFWCSVAALALHFPALYAIQRLRFPLLQNHWVAVVLLQWLFWLVVLNVLFFVVDRLKKGKQ